MNEVNASAHDVGTSWSNTQTQFLRHSLCSLGNSNDLLGMALSKHATSGVRTKGDPHMQDVNGAEIRDLILTEINEVSGGAYNTGPMMAAVRLLAALERVNFKFFGCETSNGTRVCSYETDALPGD